MASFSDPLLFLATLAALALVWRRFSAWARLAVHYPLALEWPDRTYSFTMVAADALIYRVTIGANAHGLTFHGFVQRLLGTASFVPWSEIVAGESRSWYFGPLVRLRFKKAPSIEVGIPSSVWLNIIASARPHSEAATSSSAATGV